MKVVISAFLLLLSLASCKKDSGEQEEEGPPTFAAVKNSLTNALTGVKVASYDGVSRAKLIKEIGNLQVGQQSAEFKIPNGKVEYLYIYFTQGGDTYVFSNGFGIGEGIINNLVIIGGLSASKIDESDQIFPLGEVGLSIE